LAVALAYDPPLLLADEPTGEVDEANELLILELLRRRAESGRAVVIVTHSTRAALEADHIVHLNDGRIVDA
jgi:putative ABC transport system ATP-binding protein